MSEDIFLIRYTEAAADDLRAIKDTKSRQIIAKAIDKLKTFPQERGKAMEGALAGHRRLRAARDYRIVYQVQEVQGRVVVCVIGVRKLVYALAYRRLEQGTLDDA